MQTPPTPPDEAFRLEGLRNLHVLDTPAEERFDRITRAAAHFYVAPITLVSLVDSTRLWFKSRHGVDVAETSRGSSFCGHAIRAHEPFLVEDALIDERFADNPLVVGPPFVRFYAGMPLRGPGRALIGTLCVIDQEPRTFSHSDVDYLMDMAAWVELELIRRPPEAPRGGDPTGQASPPPRAQEEAGREAHLKPMLQALPDILFRLDRRGTYLEIIARRPEGLIRPAEQLLGRTISDFAPPVEATAGLKAIGEVLDTGEARTLEYRLTIDGREEDFEARIVPCEFGQVLAIVRNISAQREQERAKDRFLRTVSHELRTPLSSIRGSLEILLAEGKAGGMPGKAQDLAALAHANTVRLSRIVDDLLGQAQQGRMALTPRPCRLHTLARQAAEAVQAYSDSFGVRLPLHPCPEEAEVHADPDRVIQILVNLLSNAVKYSPPGESVVTRLLPSVRGWAVEVEDHGPGIPKAFQPRIFQEFSQAGGPHQQPGSGLGLSISRSFAEAMGGVLEFESRPGHTVFRLELPAVTPASGPVSGAGGPLKSILHVEDDDVVSQLLATVLEDVARVEQVRTLEEARERIPGNAWAMVVLDGRLPDGSGLDLLPSLREAFGGDLPVIFYSGDDPASIPSGGFAHTFIKGRCGPDEIRQVILGIIEKQARA